MLINIIHPYTFKLTGDTLNIGPCEEYDERDRKVAAFVRKALDSKVQVLWHKYHDGKPLTHTMQDIALKFDPIYEILFDERVDIIVTTPYGIPFPDEKPEEIPQDEWEYFQQIYTSDLEIKKRIEKHNPIILIGGALENCIANASVYFHNNYKINDQELFYVPELCVSFDKNLLAKIKPQLDARNIKPIEYEKAMELLK